MISTFSRLPNREWGVRLEGAFSEVTGLSGREIQVPRRSGDLSTVTLGDVQSVSPQSVGRITVLYAVAASRHQRPRAEMEVTVTEPGVYETPDGEVFVVKPNRARTSLYAKRMIEIGGQRATEAGTRVDIEFEYAPGAIYRLTPGMRMPLERARELTILYGRCIVCGRRLRAAESVERGIGPVCVRYFSQTTDPITGTPLRRRATVVTPPLPPAVAPSQTAFCVDCGGRCEVPGKPRCIECHEYHSETLPEPVRDQPSAAMIESEEAERRWQEHDREFAAREREQESAAFVAGCRAEMERMSR